ncbi:MAG: ABC transporter ATP-binding protein [Planctomycetota bacterium]
MSRVAAGLQVADVRLARGPLELHCSFAVAAGETGALIGRNGAGKRTTPELLKGLLRGDSGSIRLGGREWHGGTHDAFVPPEQRRIGYVFQEGALLPHLSVLDNVAYGPRCRGAVRRAVRAAATGWLQRLGVPEALWRKRPDALSGGQMQRVALARALAAAPDLLLLDEPLAAVDATARLQLRRELSAHLRTFAGPRVLVAHDVADALALADRMVVLEAGKVVQDGTLDDLVARPRSRFVADFVGVNCMVGRSASDGVVEVGGVALRVPSAPPGDVLVTVHPRAISLFRERPSGSPRNVFEAPIAGLERTLDRVRVRLGGAIPLVAEVTQGAVDELRLAEGERVWFAMKATELSVSGR